MSNTAEDGAKQQTIKKSEAVALQLWNIELKILERVTQLPNKGNYLMWRRAILTKKAKEKVFANEGNVPNQGRLGSYLGYRTKILNQKFSVKLMKKSKSADSLTRVPEESSFSLGHRRTPSMGVVGPSRAPILSHPLPGKDELSMSLPLNSTPPGSPIRDTDISPRNRRGSARGRGRGRGRGRASAENLVALETTSPVVRTRSASISSGPTVRFEDADEKKPQTLKTLSDSNLLLDLKGNSAIKTTSAPIPPRDVLISPRTPRSQYNEAYEFAGMHHIFVEHNKPVTLVKFGNNEKNILAFSSQDGNISICAGLTQPRLLRSLQGHSEPVTDFAWSYNNDMIISTSTDKTVRIWAVRNGECLKVFKDMSAMTACRFHPKDPYMFIIGTAKGHIKSFNLNTAKEIESLKIGNGVTAMEFTGSGEIFFVGDKKGVIYTFQFSSGSMKAISKVNISQKPINSIVFKPLVKGRHPPRILVSSTDSTMRLIRLEAKVTNGSNLTVEKIMAVPNSKEQIRSQFCPLLLGDGICVASGSEDMSVYIYDVLRDNPVCINQLQGHSGIVFDVSWNIDETLLASCDSTGMVILWKRIKNVASEDVK